MGKSRGNSIPISATADETARLIRRAHTDATRLVSYDPTNRPEISGLLELLAAATEQTPVALADEIGAGGAAELKRRLTAAINDRLAPVRAVRTRLATAPDYLDEVLADGNRHARERAAATLVEVNSALGMEYANRE
jgi:tryptophanyl-tRNA synthetase